MKELVWRVKKQALTLKQLHHQNPQKKVNRLATQPMRVAVVSKLKLMRLQSLRTCQKSKWKRY